MARLASALAGHRLVALDTSVWIFHFEGSAAYGQAADSVLEAITQGHIGAVASELVLLELLVPFQLSWPKGGHRCITPTFY